MKRKFIVAIATAVIAISAAAPQTFADKWVQTDSGYTYQYDDGTTAKKGWLKIDDKKYYIQADGTRKTGWLKMKSGNKYYFKKDGTMVTGWLKSSKGKYYFNSKGVMQTGYVLIKKKIYLFNDDGLLDKQVKKQLVEIDGKYYYCLKDGSLAKGMVDVPYPGGKFTAYFGDDGYSISCKKTIDGVTYVFDEYEGLIDSYVNIKVDPFTNLEAEGSKITDYLSLKNFKIKNVSSDYSDKIEYSGSLTNKSDTALSIYIYANLYDKDGNIISSNVPVISTSRLNSGDTYKFTEKMYVDDTVYKIRFSEASLYPA